MRGDVHVYRPTPIAGVILGVLILCAIGVPPAFLAPNGLVTLLVTALLAGGLVLLALIRVDIVRDAAANTLTFTRHRWPRAPIVRVVALDAIAAARLERRGASRRAVLVLTNGEIVPLTGGMSGASAHAETVSVLETWLARGDGA